MQRLLGRCGAGLAGAALVCAAAAPAPATSLRDVADDDVARLVLRLEPGDAGRAHAFEGHPDATRVRDIPALDVRVIEVPARAADRVAADVEDDPAVAAVERDAEATTFAVTSETATSRVEPDDELFADQWGLERIGAPQAWATTTGDTDVVIAVLDSGVDRTHPDLGRLASGRNFTGQGARTNTTDLHGHGTWTTGVAAATTDNDTGMAGTCWECTILPVKVMTGDDPTMAARGWLTDIAAGVVWATDEGADVVNLSLGSLDDKTFMRDAMRYAIERGVAVVAAAGNYGTDSRVYPAAYDEVVGVAASSRDDDSRATYSSSGDWVSLAAPGSNIATDLLPQRYRTFRGTSSAAPLVSGTLALGIAADPEPDDTSAGRAVAALAETAEPVDYVADGLVDAAATVDAVPDTTGPSLPDEPVATPDIPSRDPDAETDPGVAMRRIAGKDRYETAEQVSASRVAPGPPRVYVTTGARFPDALAAGAAAGRFDAPVLLTTRNTLPASTARELERLAPDEVVVVGGTAAVSEDVEQDVADAAGSGTGVRRLAGDGRFATAATVATEAFEDPPVAYLATGAVFADALAGVPAAITADGPMLLTAGDELPAVTRDALAELAPDRIVLLGGRAAVSDAVADELAGLAGDGRVQRRSGATRFETAANIAEATFDGDPGAVYLATGGDFPDALAGGPAAAASGGPLLLVTREELPAPTREELRRLRPPANVTLGGTAVVSEQVEEAAARASSGG